jgi:hypothetical protein
MGLGMTVYLAEAYLHGFDPFAIEFPAGWPLGGIRWYGVAYLMGFAAAWVMVRVLAAKHRTAIPIGLVADVMIYILVGAVGLLPVLRPETPGRFHEHLSLLGHPGHP